MDQVGNRTPCKKCAELPQQTPALSGVCYIFIRPTEQMFFSKEVSYGNHQKTR